jgi:hypothetical protein
VKHFSCVPLDVSLLALPTDNRLGWKGLPEKNTLAYYKKYVTYDRKSIVKLAPEITIKNVL